MLKMISKFKKFSLKAKVAFQWLTIVLLAWLAFTISNLNNITICYQEKTHFLLFSRMYLINNEKCVYSLWWWGFTIVLIASFILFICLYFCRKEKKNKHEEQIDLLDRKKYAKRLADFIKERCEEKMSFSMILSGRFGEGKTWIINEIKYELNNGNFKIKDFRSIQNLIMMHPWIIAAVPMVPKDSLTYRGFPIADFVPDFREYIEHRLKANGEVHF